MLLDRRDAPKAARSQTGVLQALGATLCLTVGATLAVATFISQGESHSSLASLPWVRLVIAAGLASLALWRGVRLLLETARYSVWLGVLAPVVACVATWFLWVWAYLPVYWLMGGTWVPGK